MEAIWGQRLQDYITLGTGDVSMSLYLRKPLCQLPLPHWVTMSDCMCADHEGVMEFTVWIVICW